MKKIAIIFFIGLFITFSGCVKKTKAAVQNRKSNNSQINLENLIGRWKVKQGFENDDAIMIEFQKQNKEILYFIYNVMKQSDSGKIISKNGNLIFDNGTTKERFNHITITSQKITMFNEKGKQIILVKENDANIKKEEILKNVLNNMLGEMESLAGIESGDLKKATFTWNINEKESKKIHGFYVKCNVPDSSNGNKAILNDALKGMIEYLKGVDYKSNIYNTTGIQDGLSDGTYVVKLIINKGYIDLYFGELK